MNRRKLLCLAAAAAGASLSGPLLAASKCIGATPRMPGSSNGSVCVLLPVHANCARNADGNRRQIAIDTFWENETGSALSSLALGLTIRHSEFTRTVQLWQLRREERQPLASSNGLSMLFGRGAELSLDASIGDFNGAAKSSWSSAIGVDASYLLLTPRAQTGAPAAASELLFDPTLRTLRLRSGAPRDFDALLLHT